MTVIWKGGPGHKAPYRTTHVRVPEPIKAAVVEMCDDFKRGALIDFPASEVGGETVSPPKTSPDIEAAIAILTDALQIVSNYSNRDQIREAITVLGGTPPPSKQRGRHPKKA